MHLEKSNREKFISLDQLRRILDEVQKQKRLEWRRDHAMIYLGFYLALRVGECCMVDRETFRYIDQNEIRIKTLKNAPRIRVHCPKCDRRWRVSVKRCGTDTECSRCGMTVSVPEQIGTVTDATPEKIPPVIETPVIEYIKNYMKRMPDDQEFFFLGRYENEPIDVRTARKFFKEYCVAAGLSKNYSFHALRHGRGVHIWERFKDLVMVRDMLRQKSVTSAEWYMRISPDRQEELREVLDGDSIVFSDDDFEESEES